MWGGGRGVRKGWNMKVRQRKKNKLKNKKHFIAKSLEKLDKVPVMNINQEIPSTLLVFCSTMIGHLNLVHNVGLQSLLITLVCTMISHLFCIHNDRSPHTVHAIKPNNLFRKPFTRFQLTPGNLDSERLLP